MCKTTFLMEASLVLTASATDSKTSLPGLQAQSRLIYMYPGAILINQRPKTIKQVMMGHSRACFASISSQKCDPGALTNDQFSVSSNTSLHNNCRAAAITLPSAVTRFFLVAKTRRKRLLPQSHPDTHDPSYPREADQHLTCFSLPCGYV